MAPEPDMRFQSAFEFREALLALYRTTQTQPEKKSRANSSIVQRIRDFFAGLFRRK